MYTYKRCGVSPDVVPTPYEKRQILKALEVPARNWSLAEKLDRLQTESIIRLSRQMERCQIEHAVSVAQGRRQTTSTSSSSSSSSVSSAPVPSSSSSSSTSTSSCSVSTAETESTRNT